MRGKTVVITGANTGIGKAAAIAIAKMGASVVVTGRDPAKTDAAVADIRARANTDDVRGLVADFTDLAAVRALAAEIDRTCARVDVLVNNAGAVFSDRRTTRDGHEMTLQVNHLAPFLLTLSLLPKLKASAPARIVNLSSTAHTAVSRIDFDDLMKTKKYVGFRAYGQSKLANVLFTTELAQRLDGTSVTANAVHPGTVDTDFAKDGDTRGIIPLFFNVIRPFMRRPEKGAETVVYLATDPSLGATSGQYFHDRKVARTSAGARSVDDAKRLWSESERLVGLA